MTPGQIYVLAMTAGVLFIGFMIYLVFRAQANKIECWQLISSKNIHGEERADIDKIGKLVALLLVVGVVIRYVSTSELTPLLLWLLGGALTYLGGIAGFSTFVRARFGGVPMQSQPSQKS